MRSATKSALKNKLLVTHRTRRLNPPDIVILDACAVLWTVSWPGQPAKVSDFVNAAVATILRNAETAAQVPHVVFERYYKMSTKSCAG